MTPAENNKRAAQHGRRPRRKQDTCKRGHSLLNPWNVITRATGKRQCRTCDNEGQRRARVARLPRAAAPAA